MRKPFSLQDIVAECEVEEGHYQIDGKSLGLKICVPEALYTHFPFQQSAYDFLQFLRSSIFDYGIVEFPNLPLNPLNYTLAQRDPSEHNYSQNPFLTGRCQSPHQDTPPYPTAFWLDGLRQYSATWVMSQSMQQHYQQLQSATQASDNALHQRLVQQSLAQGQAILVNHTPGLLLIDNSSAQNLYHARTTKLDHLDNFCKLRHDSPLYAFNEIGLMHYIDQLDERRGQQHRDSTLSAEILTFMRRESLT
ncbi:MAG: hypothetical protein HRU21_00780 [Pseudomonadales bacterium]|nr:hypothetical protein [Pseudomonadales bacterium]